MDSIIEKKLTDWARYRGWNVDDATLLSALNTVSGIMEMKKILLSRLSFESQPSDYTSLVIKSENDTSDNYHKK